MIKKIEDFYRVMFNHFANKDGLSQFTHVIASAATGLMFLIFFVNFISFAGFILNRPLSIPNNKGFVWLFTILYLVIIYYFLFSVLKFSKTGDNNSLFSLEKKKIKLIWIVFFSNLLMIAVVCLLNIALNKR